MHLNHSLHRAPVRPSRLTQIALATSIVLSGFAAPVHAATIDTGNEDLTLRWDNQIRYNAGLRAEKVNPDFSNSPGTDATELAVRRGKLIMNRLDFLTEADLIYKNQLGARLSATAWNDFSVSDKAQGNPTLAAAGFPTEYINNQYNGYTKRYIKGPSSELLDAFVFGNFDLGSVPVNVKLGKHVVYWGEALFNLFHSVSYSQAPLDLLKATSSPGIDAKEVFRPINQLSAQAQLTSDLSVAAQVMLDWQPARLPPGGTYFGTADATRADLVAAGPNFAFPVAPDVTPDRKRGQFGVNLRWSPEALGGSVGGYYRKFNEVMPWGLLKMGSTIIPEVGGPLPQDLHLAFAKNTELYGLSFTSNVSGVNIGTELSYRKNTALISGATPVDASVIGFQGLEGARGNTWHLLANTIFVLPETPLFAGGTLQAEVVYSRLDKVTSNEGLFLGEGTTQCNAIAGGEAVNAGLTAKDVGCATKDYFGIQIGGNFDYPQALPGVNLSAPFSVSYGLKGNAAIPGGGNEGVLNWSLGLQANYRNVHQFTLKYNDGYTPYTKLASGTIVQNGGSAVANNHGWISFTYKTSF